MLLNFCKYLGRLNYNINKNYKNIVIIRNYRKLQVVWNNNKNQDNENLSRVKLRKYLDKKNLLQPFPYNKLYKFLLDEKSKKGYFNL